MPDRPIVIVHGYSDRGESFLGWKKILVEEAGYREDQVYVCSYRSLTNEISIKDIAEGFERALQLETPLRAANEFDALVHSTGMLVVRSWLVQYAAGATRLRNLIALAPATFGSPLAHKGRSWLGSIFKGSKNPLGPDFMEAGDEVLYGLELGSQFTWDLAHRDLFADEAYYGPTRRTPYVFVLCGNQSYGGLRSLINEDGADGTVRWAGCPLNSRKFVLDLTAGRRKPGAPRAIVEPFKNVDMPLVFADGLNHGTIVAKPTPQMIELVRAALAVNSRDTYEAWLKKARAASRASQPKNLYQQFVIRAVDERGDPVRDWNVQLFLESTGRIKEFDLDVHKYSRDPSFRCFQVDVERLLALGKDERLTMKVIASTGTDFVTYYGVDSEFHRVQPGSPGGKWDAQIDLQNQINAETTLFYPWTTTLVEIRLNREPLPLDPSRPNQVTWMLNRRP